MFRSDRDALANKVDDLRAENERLRLQNEAMHRDLLAKRTAGQSGPSGVYRGGVTSLGAGEQVALARHQLEAFPIWATVLLHIVTLGVSSFIRFNAMHSRLPTAERDDPSPAKAIGFHLIPYFGYYWVFWNGLRLADRINLQCHLRGLPEGVPRGLVIMASIAIVVPYLQLLTGPIAWLAVAVAVQRAVNRIVEHDARAARGGEAEAHVNAGVPGVRIPAVADLPLPDDVALEAEAEAEADAAIAEPRHERR